MENVSELAKKFLEHPSVEAGCVLTHESNGKMMRAFKGDLEDIVKLYGCGIIQLHMQTKIPLMELSEDFCQAIRHICIGFEHGHFEFGEKS